MGLRARILTVTGETGPRSRNVLKGLARSDKQRAQFDAVFKSMITTGELVMTSDKRQAKYGPPRQRGFGTVELIVVAIIIGLVIAAGFGIDQAAYDRGHAKAVADEDNKKLEEARFTREREAERDKGLLEIQQKHAAAEQRANEAEAKLAEAKREARRNGVALVTCPQPGPDRGSPAPAGGLAGSAAGPGADAPGLAADRAPRALFTWQFVREFDGGWTDLAGQPVSGSPAGGDSAVDASAPSPYSAEDVIDVADANAQRCSADRRNYAGLLAKIERAALAFDGGQR